MRSATRIERVGAGSVFCALFHFPQTISQTLASRLTTKMISRLRASFTGFLIGFHCVPLFFLLGLWVGDSCLSVMDTLGPRAGVYAFFSLLLSAMTSSVVRKHRHRACAQVFTQTDAALSKSKKDIQRCPNFTRRASCALRSCRAGRPVRSGRLRLPKFITLPSCVCV